MPKMRAVQVPFAGRAILKLGTGYTRARLGYGGVKVQACGICHSDEVTKKGQFLASNTRACPATKLWG